ncbi:MAG: I78 family peptidase inhibitor [Rhodoplanes sp.]
MGRPSRYYTTGDVLTQDFVPERLNIEVSNNSEVVRIWFG